MPSHHVFHGFRLLVRLLLLLAACGIINLHAQPVNDNFSKRTVLTGALINITGSTLGATTETGEPTTIALAGGGSVWWEWTAPSNGPVLINLVGNSADAGKVTGLAVYTGSALTSFNSVNATYGFGSGRQVVLSATAGTTYQITVNRSHSDPDPFTLAVEVLSPPPNDNFADRIVLNGTNIVASGSNRGATAEVSEPNLFYGGQTIWWSWTAPADGSVLVDTRGTSFYAKVKVYSGSSLATLVEVPGDPAIGTPAAARKTFSAKAGTTYQIAVDTQSLADLGGTFSLVLQLPGNDDVAEAFSLSSFPSTSATGSSVTATKEAGEPDHAGNAGGKSVWWHWRPQTEGIATVSTAGSTFDTLLAVYTNNSSPMKIADLVPVASDDNGNGGNLTSRLTFKVKLGERYLIAVDGTNGASGTIALSVKNNPNNDNFADRAEGMSYTFDLFDNTGATKEAGEPAHAGNSGGKSLWWTWTALANETVTFETTRWDERYAMVFRSAFDTTVAVYTGDTVNALTLVASNHDATRSGWSSATIQAVAGVTYQIAVDGFNGGSGTCYLRRIHRRAGDFFAGRISLTGAPGSTTTTNTEATLEVEEPVSFSDAGSQSMWWSWTAPASGNVSFSTMGSGANTSLTVFTGNTLNSLALMAKDHRSNLSPGSSQVTFWARAGVAYQVRVGSFSSGPHDLALSWTAPDAGDVPALFNAQAYLAGNPDVAAAIGNDHVAAWFHYLEYGVFEGRTDGDFDVRAYMARYPAAGSDPQLAALHWYTVGRAQGLRIPTGFDVVGYLARHLDLYALFKDDKYGAWLHYFSYGLNEGRDFDANFIVDEYLELNPDIKAAFGTNRQAAVLHWFQYGHPIEDRMGRVPIGFNVDNYLARYPDLNTALGGITPRAVRNVTAWHQYLAYGVLESRSDGDFEANAYLASNPDLAAVYGTDVRGAALHWFFYGRREGRRIPTQFDVQYYRTRYPDIVVIFGDDLYGSWLHYLDWGINEGRVFDELFRPDDYIALNPDLAPLIGNDRELAVLHWLHFGKAAGRPGRY